MILPEMRELTFLNVIISIRDMKIYPPSSTGKGNRLIRPRLKLIAPSQKSTSKGP